MSKRPAKLQGTPWLSPYLTVKDADAAIDFYQRAFGFEKRFAMPGPDGKTGHVEMVWREAMIMFGPEHTKDECAYKAPVTTGVASPVGLYVYCEDVDALYARAVAAGAKVVSAPVDQFYGDRQCTLEDPDGHRWFFATNVADFDPSKAPG
ncbi:MAG TPA: VOC family protein [Gemmataceae bacterium]|nr:VOC family protein [Gemmataceae bacterium]